MIIVVNGNSIDVPQDCKITSLLESLDMDTRHVAVELNREIVPREEQPERALARDDQLEIGTLVGGG